MQQRLIKLLILLAVISCGLSCKKNEPPTPPPAPIEKYGSLEGVVKNAFGQTIEGAVVQTGSASDTTNNSGYYSFQKTIAKSQNVSVSKDGFITKIQTVNVQELLVTKLDFSLAS